MSVFPGNRCPTCKQTVRGKLKALPEIPKKDDLPTEEEVRAMLMLPHSSTVDKDLDRAGHAYLELRTLLEQVVSFVTWKDIAVDPEFTEQWADLVTRIRATLSPEPKDPK